MRKCLIWYSYEILRREEASQRDFHAAKATTRLSCLVGKRNVRYIQEKAGAHGSSTLCLEGEDILLGSLLLYSYGNTIAFIFLFKAVPVATFVAVVKIMRS